MEGGRGSEREKNIIIVIWGMGRGGKEGGKEITHTQTNKQTNKQERARAHTHTHLVGGDGVGGAHVRLGEPLLSNIRFIIWIYK